MTIYEEKLVIEDISSDIFSLLIEYIYKAAVNLNPITALYLYCAAEKYPVSGLMEYCLQSLSNENSVEDLLKAYVEYESVKSSLSSKLEDRFEKALVDQLSSKFRLVTKSESFQKLDKDLLVSLVRKIANQIIIT
ncbi:uncharacterized protein TRIADDRAFT_62198 [Trichoplax adhaerens]|uniref:BTB domain-containing protein n=1 Tax=Trichoplax adhaerens TaxID=10228 RepID=B3SD42_TRIAD|nr:hypothetical protein TRIADDRAFT_62198 [Trichoplax adhaerens]EDV19387.1 hypothetical protein TRIADDRAFT_62198 [Trichoplax adhaerens]|eukprot:XP_002118162.1 hypothetical protein TRIADDRAFT_62198 [Trichoplax adhaerens]